MRKIETELPIFIAVAVTRGMLGAGIGLMAADLLSQNNRKVIGRSLFAIGLLSTVPLFMELFGDKKIISETIGKLRGNEKANSEDFATPLTH